MPTNPLTGQNDADQAKAFAGGGLVNSAMPGAPKVQTYNPTSSSVNDATDTVQGRVTSMMQDGNPLLDRARQLSDQRSNERGLVNSSIATQAGTTAMLDAATSMATPDAAAYNTQRLANQSYANDAAKTNAGAVNTVNNMGYGNDLTQSNMGLADTFTKQNMQVADTYTKQNMDKANVLQQSNMNLGNDLTQSNMNLGNTLDLNKINAQTGADISKQNNQGGIDLSKINAQSGANIAQQNNQGNIDLSKISAQAAANIQATLSQIKAQADVTHDQTGYNAALNASQQFATEVNRINADDKIDASVKPGLIQAAEQNMQRQLSYYGAVSSADHGSLLSGGSAGAVTQLQAENAALKQQQAVQPYNPYNPYSSYQYGYGDNGGGG